MCVHIHAYTRVYRALYTNIILKLLPYRRSGDDIIVALKNRSNQKNAEINIVTVVAIEIIIVVVLF